MPTLKTRDNSEIRTFINCQRQHFYAYQEGLRPIVSSIPLSAGNIAHSLARLIHAGKPWVPKLDGWYAEMMSYHAGGEEGTYNVSWDTDKLDGRYQGLRYGMAAYEEQYKAEGWKIEEHERIFSIRLPGTYTVLTGAIDGVIDIDGNLWIHELKTTSQKWTTHNSKHNPQFRTYMWAMRKEIPNIAGIALRVVQLKSPSVKFLKSGHPSTSASTHSCDRSTLEQAIVETGADASKYVDTLEALPTAGQLYLASDFQMFSPEEIDDFIEDDLRPACKGMDWAIAKGSKIRNPGTMGMNCKLCPYDDLCMAESKRKKDIAAEIRREHFIVEPDRHVYLGGDDD